MVDEIKPQVVIISLESNGAIGVRNYLGVVAALDTLRLAVVFHRIGNEFLASACPEVREDAVARY